MAVAIKVTDKAKYKIHRILMPDGTEFVLNENSSGYNDGGIRLNDVTPSITTASNNNISHPDTTVKNNDMQNSGNNTSEASKSTKKATQWFGAIGLQSPKLHKLIELLNSSIPNLNLRVNNNSMQNSIKDAGIKTKSKQSTLSATKTATGTKASETLSYSETVTKNRSDSKRAIYESFSVPVYNRTEFNSLLNAAYTTVERGGNVSEREKNLLYETFVDNSVATDESWAQENREFIEYFKDKIVFILTKIRMVFIFVCGIHRWAINITGIQ